MSTQEENEDQIVCKQNITNDEDKTNIMIIPSESEKQSVANENTTIPTDNDENPQSENSSPSQLPTEPEPLLSKRQRKKLLKIEQWKYKKIEKRQKERDRYREKRLAAFEKGEPIIRTRASRKALKFNKISKSKNPISIAIDLDFDELMIDKDICKCAKQLLWVYTINRKSSSPINLHYTGLKLGSRVQTALNRNDGYQNWDVKITDELYMDTFERDKIVYLTSDSDTVLTELNPNNIYIIGGLVDHNHHKGLCLQRAGEQQIQTARLPIGEHVSLKSRTVLTIVHVFDILLRVSQGESWSEAFLGVLPIRKGAKPIENTMEDNENDTNNSNNNNQNTENCDNNSFEIEDNSIKKIDE